MATKTKDTKKKPAVSKKSAARKSAPTVTDASNGVNIPNTGKTAEAISAIVKNDQSDLARLSTIQGLADVFFKKLYERTERQARDPNLPILNAHDIRRLLDLAFHATNQEVSKTECDNLARDLADYALMTNITESNTIGGRRARVMLANLISELGRQNRTGENVGALTQEQIFTLLTAANELDETRDRLPKTLMHAIASASTSAQAEHVFDPNYEPATITWPAMVGGDQDPSTYPLTQKYIFEFMQNVNKSIYKLTNIDTPDSVPAMEWEEGDDYAVRRRNDDRTMMTFVVLLQSFVHMLLHLDGQIGKANSLLDTVYTFAKKQLAKNDWHSIPGADKVVDGQKGAMTVENAVSKEYLKAAIEMAINRHKREEHETSGSMVDMQDVDADAEAPIDDWPSVGGMHFHNCNIGFVGGLGPTTIQNCQNTGPNHQLDTVTSSPAITAPASTAPVPKDECGRALAPNDVGDIMKILSGFTPEMAVLCAEIRDLMMKKTNPTTQLDKENA